MDQTYQNLEIILLDDGSTDSSREICDAYAVKDERIQVHHLSNHGVSFTRNLGLNMASGQFVAFVDSDDWIESDMYETMVHAALAENADVVIQPFIFHCNDEFPQVFNTKELKIMSGKEALTEMLKGQLFSGQVCNKLFRRELLPLDMFDATIHIYEDIYALWEIFSKCKKVVWQDIHCYHYIMHDSSAMHREYNPKLLTGRYVVDAILEKSRDESEGCLLYARLFCLRANSNFCCKAYEIRKKSRSIYLNEFMLYRQSIKQYYDNNLKLYFRRIERIDFYMALLGRHIYGLWRNMYRLLKALREILFRVRKK